jgi:DNA polymerase III sliding clamp (beta) subunit (PCNA family)
MFKFSIDDARRFKDATDAIVNLIDEGQLEVGKEGLFLRAMDPSQIAMLVFSMPASTFSSHGPLIIFPVSHGWPPPLG